MYVIGFSTWVTLPVTWHCHTISPLFTKLVWSRWLDVDLLFLIMDLNYLSVHKHENKENLANIQLQLNPAISNSQGKQI